MSAAPPLRRSMKVFGALMLTLSAATPASSVFVIMPDVISAAGSGALIAMAIGGLVAVCVAQIYAELGSAFPLAGGEYVMTGRTLGPTPGFVMLGLNLFNSVVTAAVFALGAQTYLGLPGPPWVGAMAVVAGATILGVLHIRANAWITGAFVLVELAALVVLAGLGFAHPARGLAELIVHPVMTGAGGALAPAGLAAIGLAASAALFAYDGYGAAVYFGEETHEAPTGVARAIILALTITAISELVPLVAVFVGAPNLKSLVASQAPFLDFARDRGGAGLARWIGLGVGLALVNAAIATVLLTARQLYSTGRDGTWGGGADARLARVAARTNAPWVATLAAGVLAGALCFVPLTLLVIAAGAGAALIYATLCLALLKGRQNGATAHGRHRAPMGAWLAWGVLAALAGVLWSDWLDPAEGRPGLFIAFGVGLVFAAWRLVLGRGHAWRPGAETVD